LIASSRRIIGFTGAGISAESGIPTYRGAGGVWTRFDPEKYASIDYFRQDPGYFWTFFREVRLGTVRDATPNGAHRALAELEHREVLCAVVTQNIDGLQQRAGSQNVLELHGNTTRFYCLKCRERYDLDAVASILEREPIPLCGSCNGVIRPDVTLFGELLPEGVFEAATVEARSCDLMLVVGSSLVVYPAADIPYQAKLSGAKLAIINIDPTPLDSLADLTCHLPAAAFLAEAVGIPC
jgi:NAD-dependent deacetylase